MPREEYWTSLDADNVEEADSGAATGQNEAATPVKPRRSSRVASGGTGSGQGAVNYDERS